MSLACWVGSFWEFGCVLEPEGNAVDPDFALELGRTSSRRCRLGVGALWKLKLFVTRIFSVTLRSKLKTISDDLLFEGFIKGSS
jgi:hypothetical protein